MAEEKNTSPIGGFDNEVTMALLVAIIFMIGGGLLITVFVSFLGVIPACIGVLMWWAGDTQIPVDPRTAGMLTFWDQPIMTKKDGVKVPIVVGGRTILAPYFPFFIDIVEFETTRVDKDFKMSVLSGGTDLVTGKSLKPVPLEGHISVTLEPDLEDLMDYIQSGKMEKIMAMLDDIVYEKAKAHARAHPAQEIADTSEVISGPLRKDMDAAFEAKSFGVKTVKVQAVFNLPKGITDAMVDAGAEQYDRDAEFQEYKTDLDAAFELQQRLVADPNRTGPVPNLNECLEQIKALRLIRDGRTLRIDTTGSVGNFILPNANFNMGEPAREGRKGQKGEKK